MAAHDSSSDGEGSVAWATFRASASENRPKERAEQEQQIDELQPVVMDVVSDDDQPVVVVVEDVDHAMMVEVSGHQGVVMVRDRRRRGRPAKSATKREAEALQSKSLGRKKMGSTRNLYQRRRANICKRVSKT